LDIVGKYYSEGKYYLPQMIASANTMKIAFAFLKDKMPKESLASKGTVIICTVAGDIHDIGKNIVGMMLENNGFEVIDLGKDVSKEKIIDAAKKHHADLILLSALLTTTMIQMREVKETLATEGIEIPVMVGGAVVTPDYAKHINANYSADAASAVQVALKLLAERKK
jgi:5-methyltetrahydrofolate--homocysteine methyltransferase